MSAQTVETILSRAMSDAKFADSLFASPDQALTGYDLSAEEAVTLKGMTRADLDSVAASSPEERKSFALTLNHNQTVQNIRK
jgi:hypothetical protein